MGYSTDFTGHVTVTPPLNAAEASFLHAFSESRRMTVPEGPYSTKDYGFGHGPDVIDTPPVGQPSRWCDWVPTADGAGIEWNGTEKFQSADAWMQYLIDHFLSAGAFAWGLPGFEDFTFDHVVNGTIDAQGEDPDDTWLLIVTDNSVNKVKVSDQAEADATPPLPVSWSGEVTWDNQHGPTTVRLHDDTGRRVDLTLDDDLREALGGMLLDPPWDDEDTMDGFEDGEDPVCDRPDHPDC